MVRTLPPQKNKLWYLKETHIFGGLSDTEVARLAERALMRQFGRGRVMLDPEERSDLIYIIKEGRAKVSAYSSDGKEQILAILEPGDLFGELALVGEREPVHIEAFEDTLVCGVRREDLENLLRAHPDLALRLIRALAARLRLAEEEIENLVFRDVPGRLATVLLRMGEDYGTRDDGRGIRLTLRLTHQDLAAMIGATRETVTNILNRFREDGLTDVAQRFIVIRDPERLRRLTNRRRDT
jgi:CRP-like cAMP-binding protein